jgi:hypothetical protein
MSPEDVEFERLMEIKQKDQLNKLMEKLLVVLEENKNEQLSLSIKNLIVLLSKFLTEIKNQSVIQENTDETSEMMGELTGEMRKYIEIAQIKKQWKLSFNRDDEGYIQSPIILTQK